jgi:hypothetical protein
VSGNQLKSVYDPSGFGVFCHVNPARIAANRTVEQVLLAIEPNTRICHVYNDALDCYVVCGKRWIEAEQMRHGDVDEVTCPGCLSADRFARLKALKQMIKRVIACSMNRATA